MPIVASRTVRLALLVFAQEVLMTDNTNPTNRRAEPEPTDLEQATRQPSQA
jgi:hypothetical protein